VAAAITLLLLLRFIEGIFLGGEYTAATPLALEYAPAARRGFIGSVIQCAASIGPFVVALLFTIVLDFAPDNSGLSSPYVQWGWRIPFYIGFLLSVVVALFIRRRVDDSKTWKEAAPGRQPMSSDIVPNPRIVIVPTVRRLILSAKCPKIRPPTGRPTRVAASVMPVRIDLSLAEKCSPSK